MARKRGKDDRPVQAGDVFAIPIKDFGCVRLVVGLVPAPDARVDFALAYIQPEPHADDMDGLEVPASWREVWVGLVTTRPMRKGRWHPLGRLPGFDPVDWPLPPWRSSPEDGPAGRTYRDVAARISSIEVTVEAPSMTVVENRPVSLDESKQFPFLAVTTSASALEKAIRNHLKGREKCFHDMPFVTFAMTPTSIPLWRRTGVESRAAAPPLPTYLPAGRKTDRGLTGGDWMVFPMLGGGFGAAILVAKLEEHQRFFSDVVVMTMRRRWSFAPSLDELVVLTAEDGAILAQTSMICVRDGRWRVVGRQPNFSPTNWPWPTPYERIRGLSKQQCRNLQQSGKEAVTLMTPEGPQNRYADTEVLALDPESGSRCRGSSMYGLIEWNTAAVIDGWFLDPSRLAVVEPDLVAAWRTINAHLADV